MGNVQAYNISFVGQTDDYYLLGMSQSDAGYQGISAVKQGAARAQYYTTCGSLFLQRQGLLSPKGGCKYITSTGGVYRGKE